MTVITSQPGTDTGPGEDSSPVPPGTGAPEPEVPQKPPAPPVLVIPGGVLILLSALLLGFAANLTVVGHIQHARAQQVGYADLRGRLALGTAPVGQTDVGGQVLEPGTPIALLRAPAIHLREVVFEGTASGTLMSGPGHRRDTVLPGQAGTSIVMGRQWGYGSPFEDIGRLRTGDTLTVTTGQGRHTYRVTGIRHAGDPVPAALQQGQGRLTLMTATGSPYTPSGILRVDATLASPVQPAPAPVFGPGSLSAAEQPLNGDHAAWLPITLWCQLLLVVTFCVTWAYRRWGPWQSWIVGVPALTAIVIALSGSLTRLLPNLL